MKTPNLSKWPGNTEPLTGLLLFAQLWDEMLFDYTLDSYKPRRFNVLGLCSELIDAYEYYEHNILTLRSLSPIRDELLDALHKDGLAKHILNTKLPILKKILEQWDPTRPDKKITYAAASILKTLAPVIQKRIVDELLKALEDPHKKADIIDLGGRLLTEILRKGYSPNYVYYSLQRAFFGRRSIQGIQDAITFLKLFDGADKKYEVVFKMSNDAKLLAKNAEDDFMQCTDQRQAKFNGNRNEMAFLEKVGGEIFITTPDIDAKDSFSARRIAEERLADSSTLVGFFIHRVQIDPEQDALVYEGVPPTAVYLVKPPVRPTLKRGDLPDDAFDEPLRGLAESLISTSVDNKTSNRLYGALRAHIAGVHAGISENQFSNLWTALETIAAPSADKNTITIILNRLIPILCLKYFLKLVYQLRNDIKNCIRTAFSQCLEYKLGDETEMEFLVRILSEPECDPICNILYSACNDNPLLRYRIFRFQEFLMSSNLAIKLLHEHEQRVTWHLQRLYRARNTVIHAGFGYELIDLLTENVHDYFDHALSEITDRLKKDEHNTSIEKVFAEYEWEYQAYQKRLEGLSGEPPSYLVAKIIVFGPDEVTKAQ